MKANGEFISTIAAPRNATIFARSAIMHRLELAAMVYRFAQIRATPKKVRRDLQRELIIALDPRPYSVSQFH